MDMKKVLFILAAVFTMVACSETELELVDEISIAPQKNVFSAMGGSAEVTVQSSGAWTLEGDSEWVEPSVREGADGETVVFEAGPNDSETQKSAEFIFRTGTATAKLEFALKGLNAEPDAVVLSTESATVDGNGGEVSVEIKSTVDWTLSGECEWATPSVKSGKDGDIVVFTVDPNDTGEQRSCEFSFTAGDANAEFKIESLAETVSEVTITSSKDIVKSYRASTIEVEVNTNINYRGLQVTIPEEASEWLKHTITLEGEQEHTAIVCITLSPNSIDSDREAIVSIGLGSIMDELSIKQFRKSQLETEQTKYEFLAEGGNLEIPVTSNVEYEFTVSEGASWITYVENRDGKECFTVSAADAKRTAEIEFVEKNAPDGESPLSFIVEVTQKGPALVTMSGEFASSRLYAPTWKNAAPLTNIEKFSVEGLLYLDSTPESGSYYSVFGVEGAFEIRVNEDSQLQVIYLEETTEPDWDTWEEVTVVVESELASWSTEVVPGRWYHFAVTYDLDEDDSINCYMHWGEDFAESDYDYERVDKIPAFTLAVPYSETETEEQKNFWIGYSGSEEHCFDGKLAELRIWNRALAEEEIEDGNHMFTVDPASDGLVAYWKFNEGNGNIVKDCTSYGNDLTAQSYASSWQSGFQWQPVSLP